MMPRMRRHLATLACAVLAGSIVLAGCGGGEESPASDDDGGGARAGGLVHADGAIHVTDAGIELTPVNDADVIVFAIGPEVERGTLRALEASGAKARINYRLSEEAPVAVSVVAAPTIADDAESYVGTVKRVTAEEIVLAGDDGERRFVIAPADAIAFDVAHLQEHADAGKPVKVYYRSVGDVDNGLAYEDA